MKVNLTVGWPDHAPALYEIINEDREHLSRFKWAATITEADVSNHLLLNRGDVWTILVDGKPAGVIRVWERAEGDQFWFDVGYWVGKRYSSKGVAKEALKQLLELFTPTMSNGVVEYRACIRADNFASAKVLLANGFSVNEDDVESAEDDGVAWLKYSLSVNCTGEYVLYGVVTGIAGSYPSPLYENLSDLKSEWDSDVIVKYTFNTEKKLIKTEIL